MSECNSLDLNVVNTLKNVIMSNSSINQIPFYYFEPVLIRFSDPGLIASNCCFLCGSFDRMKNLIICVCCKENYHIYCLIPAGKE